MNELYTTLAIAFVCAGVALAVRLFIGYAKQVSDFDPCNVGSEE